MTRLMLCDYDKPHRCPGWSGSGWSYNKRDSCDDVLPDGVRRWRRYADASGYGPGWQWMIRRTNCCDTLVLPYVLRWLHWRTYYYKIGRFIR